MTQLFAEKRKELLHMLQGLQIGEEIKIQSTQDNVRRIGSDLFQLNGKETQFTALQLFYTVT